jgi:hypothetical protein
MDGHGNSVLVTVVMTTPRVARQDDSQQASGVRCLIQVVARFAYGEPIL